jgi:hypothetical protein
MRDTRDKEDLKERVKKWAHTSGVKGQPDMFDMVIWETFTFIYTYLEMGVDIREIGNDLGVFPLP